MELKQKQYKDDEMTKTDTFDTHAQAAMGIMHAALDDISQCVANELGEGERVEMHCTSNIVRGQANDKWHVDRVSCWLRLTRDDGRSAKSLIRVNFRNKCGGVDDPCTVDIDFLDAEMKRVIRKNVKKFIRKLG